MKEGHFDKTQAIVRLKAVDKPVANFKEFLTRDKTKIWRMWIYRRIFTPYEWDSRFSDETIYENEGQCMFVCIESAHDLPDKDLVLGVRVIYDRPTFEKPVSDADIEYYKFSEIRLAYYPKDKTDILEEEW